MFKILNNLNLIYICLISTLFYTINYLRLFLFYFSITTCKHNFRAETNIKKQIYLY
jgi:hypothetical protein